MRNGSMIVVKVMPERMRERASLALLLDHAEDLPRHDGELAGCRIEPEDEHDARIVDRAADRGSDAVGSRRPALHRASEGPIAHGGEGQLAAALGAEERLDVGRCWSLTRLAGDDQERRQTVLPVEGRLRL